MLCSNFSCVHEKKPVFIFRFYFIFIFSFVFVCLWLSYFTIFIYLYHCASRVYWHFATVEMRWFFTFGICVCHAQPPPTPYTYFSIFLTPYFLPSFCFPFDFPCSAFICFMNFTLCLLCVNEVIAKQKGASRNKKANNIKNYAESM